MKNLTTKQVAKRLGVHPSEITTRCAAEDSASYSMPNIRTNLDRNKRANYRFAKDEFDAWRWAGQPSRAVWNKIKLRHPEVIKMVRPYPKAKMIGLSRLIRLSRKGFYVLIKEIEKGMPHVIVNRGGKKRAHRRFEVPTVNRWVRMGKPKPDVFQRTPSGTIIRTEKNMETQVETNTRLINDSKGDPLWEVRTEMKRMVPIETTPRPSGFLTIGSLFLNVGSVKFAKVVGKTLSVCLDSGNYEYVQFDSNEEAMEAVKLMGMASGG